MQINQQVCTIQAQSQCDAALCFRYKERIERYAETFHPDFYRPLGKAVGLVEHVAKVCTHILTVMATLVNQTI